MKSLPTNGRICCSKFLSILFLIIIAAGSSPVSAKSLQNASSDLLGTIAKSDFVVTTPVQIPVVLNLEVIFPSSGLIPARVNAFRIRCSKNQGDLYSLTRQPIFSLQIRPENSDLSEEIKFSFPFSPNTLEEGTICTFSVPFRLPESFAGDKCISTVGVLSSGSDSNPIRLSNQYGEGLRIPAPSTRCKAVKPLHNRVQYEVRTDSGIHQPEFDHDRRTKFRWLSRIACFSFTNPCEDVILYLEMTGMDALQNEARLLIQDEHLDTIHLTGNESRTLYRLSREFFGTNTEIHVRLEFRHSVIPADVGWGEDLRTLSARLYHFEVFPESSRFIEPHFADMIRNGD